LGFDLIDGAKIRQRLRPVENGDGAKPAGPSRGWGSVSRAAPHRRAATRDVVADLDRARELGLRESGLAVVATGRVDGSVQASIVNAGVVDHPATGDQVVGFVVAKRGARKLINLRAHPYVAVVFRSGWEWVAVEGHAELAGPDDPLEGFEPADIVGLLRIIYAAAAGGSPEDWKALDDTMAAEGHTAVLVRPRRVYSNPA
jgi:PPOX class probable F420-dependent enzyme